LKRLMLLIAAGSLWLFLAAVPVFADGGPHVSAINNGTGNGGATLAADSCAGCHRAHTAQGEPLLKDSGGIATCTACHGASGLGATTDVENGIQYVLGTNPVRTGTTLGFLRSGGFVTARIGSGEASHT
jgi:predicted CXXCH cytochrome family protein